MASNLKQLREDIKVEWLDFLTEVVQRRGDETLQTASNEFAVPVVDGEGGEHCDECRRIDSDDASDIQLCNACMNHNFFAV